MKKKYSITGIDCANCAAKLEAKMNELPEVESVTLSFTTQQLYVEAENPDETVKALQALADKVALRQKCKAARDIRSCVFLSQE